MKIQRGNLSLSLLRLARFGDKIYVITEASHSIFIRRQQRYMFGVDCSGAEGDLRGFYFEDKYQLAWQIVKCNILGDIISSKTNRGNCKVSKYSRGVCEKAAAKNERRGNQVH